MLLIINICKEELHYFEFVKPIEDILLKNKIKFLTRPYLKLNDSDIKKADKIIICGTSLKDNEFIENFEKFDWIKNFKKPILGICGGSHIIGLILRHGLKRKKEIGLKEIKIKEEFLGIRGKLQVYYLHQFYALPDVFHKGNIYAILFHPEVRNKNLIENFAKF
jgi:GMP synthase (glutamine-hydrolysing)